MTSITRSVFLLALALPAALSAQTVITTFSSLTDFNNAIGSATVTVEDFTSTFHFPISTGILNSDTNLPGIGIVPGTIQPGVTYSTTIGTSNFFNIDAGGGFSGGFLDTVTGVGPLTITFNGTVTAFGFDTNTLMGSSFTITINFTSGAPYTNSFGITSSLPVFYGFGSNFDNITSVILLGQSSSFTFAIDNFRFTNASVIPEPGVAWLLGAGCVGMAVLRLRRRRRQAAV